MTSRFPSLSLEGGLFAIDLIDQIADGTAPGQKPADFGLESRYHLTDEIAALWTDARAFWTAFQNRLERLSSDDTATSITRDQWIIPLLSLFSYELTYNPKAHEVDNSTYAISHRASKDENAPPIHVVGARQSLDRRPESGRPRLAPHALLQEYLNRTEHLWGFVTNGCTLRLLRDSQLIRRQAYIEFDLKQMMENERFADFSLLYRLIHRSRLPRGMDDASDCLLERYYTLTVEQGGRVRDHLRDGVEKALKGFAQGFLCHPRNQPLREKAIKGELNPRSFYQQLLRLIYRLLFLMVAEERNLITENMTYREHYSISRLRRLTELRSAHSDHEDLYLGLQTLFRLFQDEQLGNMLQVPPLNGDLFNALQTADLENVCITNRDLLTALWHLSMYRENERTPWRRVNFSALDVEELGSVYESLLDFQPVFIEQNGHPAFDLAYGMERKSTGSYYTPPELVNELIKSALIPVLEERLKGLKTPQEKEKTILNLKVCDPASGSGHFLLAAARRLGRELAKARTGDDEPAPEQMRLAIRDVITHCIYAVDKNPLAVDLCKVALWMEGHSKGKPLTFLDHRVRCGDSLVGVFDIGVLEKGIPDEAFDPVTGDDKAIARTLKKQNREERADRGREKPGQQRLFFESKEDKGDIAEAYRHLQELSDDTPEQIRMKAAAFQSIQSQGTELWHHTTACHIWTGAFFVQITEENRDKKRIPTTDDLRRYIETHSSDPRIPGYACVLAQKHNFFHWPLEFPEVFAQGGFDVLLGNPPWEMLQLEEQEFFAMHDIQISKLTGETRKQAILELNKTNPLLSNEFKAAKHTADSQNKFFRNSSRFHLTAIGKMNTYALFCELFVMLLAPEGRGGIIVPTGIATDDATKEFFCDLSTKRMLVSLYDFQNSEALFPGVHRSYKFCLLTINCSSSVSKSKFAFFATRVEHLGDERRCFTITPDQIKMFNPNTSTMPVFRTRADTELTLKIYEHVPILLDDKCTGKNPWDVQFRQGLFNMTSDSSLFINKNRAGYLPLYEAKMMHQFDHRWTTYVDAESKELSPEEKCNPNLSVQSRYWVPATEVKERLNNWKGKNKNYHLVQRAIADMNNEKRLIFALIPLSGIGNSAVVHYIATPTTELCCYIANFNACILDYLIRVKAQNPNLNQFILKQLPIFQPSIYSHDDLMFVSRRVLELVYTAWDIKPFADDLWGDADDSLKAVLKQQWEDNRAATGGHKWEPPEWAEIAEDGIPLPPFKWDENRRAQLRAELDAYYAKLYGLTRDELRYILDPKDIYGPDFPGETFRVLKKKEERQYGEYRTRRLVLEAWDKLITLL
jgi:hypothetical protein